MPEQSPPTVPVRVVLRCAADVLGGRARGRDARPHDARRWHDASAALMALHRDRGGPRPLRGLPEVDAAAAGLLLAWESSSAASTT